MRIMTHKKRVNLFIDSELLDSARAYGLNLSKFMGNGLNVFFSSVEKGYSWKLGKYVMRRAGFEPADPFGNGH